MIARIDDRYCLTVLQDFFKLLVDYSLCILPAFLIAILISAALVEMLPDSFFERILGKSGIHLILISSAIGAIIPLCTCGMIPLAYKLQKKGTSWLIVLSFLTSGNACSITTLILTLTLGLKITFIRFLASVIFGILVAYIFTFFLTSGQSALDSLSFINKAGYINKTLFKRIKQEFIGLIVSFGPWVITAIFIAALITLFLKPEQVIKFAGVENVLSPFILAWISFPFYFCGGVDIPIAKALLEKGASLGSVIAFMLASPGINLTSFLVYQKWLGKRLAIIYILVSALVCGFIGLGINFFILPLTPFEMR